MVLNYILVGCPCFFVVAPAECKTWRTKDGGCCVFPFFYQGKLHDKCIFDGQLWCSVTDNYDTDRMRGACQGEIYLWVLSLRLKLAANIVVLFTTQSVASWECDLMIAPNRYRFYRFRRMIPWLIMIMTSAWRVHAATSNLVNSTCTERLKNRRAFCQTCFSWQVVQAWDSRARASLTRPYSSHTHPSFLASLDCSRSWHVKKMRAVGHRAKSREARKALSKSREADTKSQKDLCKLLNVKNTLPWLQ